MLSVECAEAFFYNSHTVLGKKLKPFSLYHHFVLEAIESPLVKGQPSSIIDLYIAACVCSQEYPLDQTKIPTGSWWSILVNSFRFGYYSVRYKHSREVAKFYHYTKDFSSMPNFWNEKGKNGKKPTGLPDVFAIMVTLIVSLGYKEKDAWNCPVGKAVWLSTASSIINGAESKIISAEAKAFMDSMKNGKE